MFYRYKLKNCKENENLHSRQLEGITLYKKKWLYRDRPLVLHSFLNLIDVETASNREEFEAKDLEKKRNMQAEIRQRSIENIKKNPKMVNETPQEEKKTIENLEEKTTSELKEYATKLGFTVKEVYDLNKKDLLKLIDMEKQINESY